MAESETQAADCPTRRPSMGTVLTVVILTTIVAWAGIVWYRTGFQVKPAELPEPEAATAEHSP